MTREEIIRNLKYTMEKHKNDTVAAFGTNISLMCKDILDYLEQEPCEDCIRREAVDTLVDELAGAISDERCCLPRGRSTATIMQDILDLPSVTPKQRVGHWIFPNPSTKMICECSLCGGNGRAFGKDNYCPTCGARMGSEDTE